MLSYILSAAVAYLLGSLSFGIILSKVKYKKDIRDYGSNNAGMTNTLRTFGKRAAAFVFIFDALKGTAAVLLAKYVLSFSGNAQLCAYIALFFAVVGHMFPVYFKFKGGKGAATALGATTALAPLTFPLVMVPFITFGIYYCKGEPTLVPTVSTALVAVLIVFMHRSNIKRILKGEERKIGSDKPKAEKDKN